MALEQITFNIGAFNDSDAGGNNYFTNTVFEVKNQSDNTFATIYADSSGTTQIPQNGIDNISNSIGECNFYIDEGEFYIEVDGNKKNFKTKKDASAITTDSGASVQEYIDGQQFESIDAVKSYANLSALIGQRIQTKEYHAGTGYGGATYEVVSSGSVTPNDIDIIQGVADGVASLVLRHSLKTYIPEKFGVTFDGMDRTVRMQRVFDKLSASGGGDVIIHGVVSVGDLEVRDYVRCIGVGRYTSGFAGVVGSTDVLKSSNLTNRGWEFKHLLIDASLSTRRCLNVTTDNNLWQLDDVYIVNSNEHGLWIDGNRTAIPTEIPRTSIVGGRWGNLNNIFAFNNEQSGIYLKDCVGTRLTNSISSFNRGDALYLDNSSEVHITDFLTWRSKRGIKCDGGFQHHWTKIRIDLTDQEGILLVNSDSWQVFQRAQMTDIQIFGASQESDNTYSGLKIFGGSGSTFFEDNVLSDLTIDKHPDSGNYPNTNKYAVEIVGNTARNNISIKSAKGAATSELLDSSGEDRIKFDSFAPRVKARGTVTVSDGTDTGTGNFSLGFTPRADQITVTPTANINTSTRWWISDITSSTFLLRFDSATSGGNKTFSFSIDVSEQGM